MPRLVDSRSVLAVRNLGESTRFYTEVLGFRRDPIEAEGSRGAEVILPPADKPWGLREFVVRTPDGHRIMFGEPKPERPGH